jgi:hypothetical protein
VVWWNWEDVERRPGISWAVEHLNRRSIPTVQPGHVTIAVAHLDHDTGHEHEALLLDELLRFEEAEVIRIDRVVSWPQANTERQLGAVPVAIEETCEIRKQMSQKS